MNKSFTIIILIMLTKLIQCQEVGDELGEMFHFLYKIEQDDNKYIGLDALSAISAINPRYSAINTEEEFQPTPCCISKTDREHTAVIQMKNGLGVCYIPSKINYKGVPIYEIIIIVINSKVRNVFRKYTEY